MKDEEFVIQVQQALGSLSRGDLSEPEIVFPTTLTSEQRKFIHDVARAKGLFSKSRGKEKNGTRYVSVSLEKKSRETEPSNSIKHDLREYATQFPQIYAEILNYFEDSPNWRQELEAQERSVHLLERNMSENRMPFIKAPKSSRQEQIPFNRTDLAEWPLYDPQPVPKFRKSLPVFEFREELLSLVGENNVVV